MNTSSALKNIQGTVVLAGAGKMGGAMLSGWLAQGLAAKSVVVIEPHATDDIRALAAKGVRLNPSPKDVGNVAALVVALKPQMFREAGPGLKPFATPSTLVVSIMAGTTIAGIAEVLIGKDLGGGVVRAMPNTPCLIRQGMIAIAKGKHATDGDVKIAQAIFGSMGRTVVVDEKHMDAITGLSASGPAYVYLIIESLAEGGVKLGLPRELSTELSAQTLLGASSLVLHTGEHPAKLKDMVTTPAGCTIDGLLELEEGGLRVTLIKAVVRAAERARQLVESQNT